MTLQGLNTLREEMPTCIRFTTIGKIVSAHCDACGMFIAASESPDRLKMALQMHPCVKEKR